MTSEELSNFKLIFVGDVAVGKTSIINYFIKKESNNCIATIGIEFYKQLYKFNNKRVNLNIWDPCGQQKFYCLVKSYFRGLHGVFLVYDVTNISSLYKLNHWFDCIKQEINPDEKPVIFLVANKCDLVNENSVAYSKSVAQYFNIEHYEVSSKTGLNIDTMFLQMCLKIDPKVKAAINETIQLNNSCQTLEPKSSCSC